MKILVNGYTVTEHLELRRNKKDINLVDGVLENIKANKTMYLRLVLLTALMLHFDVLIYADSFGASLDRVGNRLLNMLMNVAKWGSICMGIKEMITTVLNGGNVKHALNKGLMYLLMYVFISIYPQLFSMFSDIKF